MQGNKGVGKGCGGVGNGFSASGFKPEARRVVLDERYFRKLPTFTGLPEKFRGWMFQLRINVGSVDGELSRELQRVLSEGHDDSWDPRADNNLDEYLYEAYKEELYAVLVQNTSDDALGVVRSVVERGYGDDGYKALNDLAHRYDSRTAAALLHAFLAVVNPSPITKISEVVSSVNKWEGCVSQLKARHGEDLGDKLNLAILIAMLPKELGDMVVQNSMLGAARDIDFAKCRDHVLQVVQQKSQMLKPTPMDIDPITGLDANGCDINGVF